MGEALVLELDNAVVERLRAQAARHGRSLQAEAGEILAAATYSVAKAEALAALDAIRAATTPWQPGMPTAADLIREDRDGR
jgi:plasmid stability protein